MSVFAAYGSLQSRCDACCAAKLIGDYTTLEIRISPLDELGCV
jgi:hypothetical protein